MKTLYFLNENYQLAIEESESEIDSVDFTIGYIKAHLNPYKYINSKMAMVIAKEHYENMPDSHKAKFSLRCKEYRDVRNMISDY